MLPKRPLSLDNDVNLLFCLVQLRLAMQIITLWELLDKKINKPADAQEDPTPSKSTVDSHVRFIFYKSITR